MARRLGVGTYRMVAGNAAHEDSLLHALRRGFSVVDTSPNYGDGLAEALVGSSLARWRAEGGGPVDITSKFGFIQGRTLQEHKDGGKFPGAVEYTDDCLHSIHPDFMRHQLANSLAALGVDQVSTYLVHNPEHLLMSKLPPDTPSGSDQVRAAQEDLASKLEDTFAALEEEVARGSIGRYGVSSNSFALPTDHVHYVPLASVLTAAERAAKRVGAPRHSLAAIELPANVIERTGLTPVDLGGNGCAQLARANGVDVMVNRALTAFDPVGSWRLADADFPLDYASSRDALVEHLTPPDEDTTTWPQAERDEWEETLQACRWLVQLVNDLDGQMAAFSSVMHYQDDLMRKVIPMINSKLDGMDDETSNMLFGFFSHYEAAVRSVAGQQTRTHVFESISQDTAISALKGSARDDFVPPALPSPLLGAAAQVPMQDFALAWLRDQPSVSTVLLGALRPEYADQAARVFGLGAGPAQT